MNPLYNIRVLPDTIIQCFQFIEYYFKFIFSFFFKGLQRKFDAYQSLTRNIVRV